MPMGMRIFTNQSGFDLDIRLYSDGSLFFNGPCAIDPSDVKNLIKFLQEGDRRKGDRRQNGKEVRGY